MISLRLRPSLRQGLCWIILCAGAAWTSACSPASNRPDAPRTVSQPGGSFEVTSGGRDLFRPKDTPAGKTWVYQICLPFQLSRDKAAAFCNVREGLVKGVDFECGVDVIPFDSLSDIKGDDAVVVTRNQSEPNPNSVPPGQPATIVKYPMRGGFVPLGAKRNDGAPLPHAGTGFGINQAIAWKIGDPGKPPYGVNMFTGPEKLEYFEVHQFAYDGKLFKVTSTERVPVTNLLPGWTILDGAMTNAIPDGEDFLVGMTGGKIDAAALARADPSVASASGAGVMRWRHDGKAWRAVAFAPVTGSDGSFEPSLIRDTDGKLLFSARGTREPVYNDIRVWRSEDNGATWNKIVHARGAISSAPVSLNQAADGTPYVAANLYEVFLAPFDFIKVPKDSEGRPRLGGATRSTLCLWPLNRARNALDAPAIAKDCNREFGPPPGKSAWRVDHPSATTVRLADGKWHNVLGMRVLEYGELTFEMPPTPRTGAYLEEVISSGQAVPLWTF